MTHHKHESEEKTFTCSECGYSVRVASTFVVHEEFDQVLVSAQVECDECGNVMEEE